MLITQDSPTLSIKHISAHLKVGEWIISRELKIDEPGRLRGTKETGPGLVGQGGQWVVDTGEYLDWLGVPEVDRHAAEARGGLPPVHPFADAAVRLGLATPAQPEAVREAPLIALVDRYSLAHLKVGLRRYLSDSQLAAVRTALRRERRSTAG